MMTLNIRLFDLLNASADASSIVVAWAKLIASGLVFAVAILLTALWVWGDPRRRGGLAATAIAAALALVSNQIVGLLWYEPRPFMVGLGRTLMAHVPENSFPSDHTTFMLTVGFALIATRAAPTWGKVVSGMGVLVAWSRIYLGVHFPIDMLASALIACLFGGVSVLLLRPVHRWILPIATPLYEASLRVLHLPPRMFPRSSSGS
ncbi:undecaprenyl-diphosphatase [Alsobacter metallidurans]|uniref:Undecaprenyl-diphosphatase n=1 Tax=Alsobacter metallidurans TaxID=340221 RepID=A0A917I6A9_9HYPH|nr:undecaprenyl-diphosphatase [Alsobacter metallidurans]GGH18983.1 undecaprenyl-diphosphatase [Alsobacter metallidurans]